MRGTLSRSPVLPMKVKVLCSFDGELSVSETDGKIQYKGGDTHLIEFLSNFRFSDFVHKIILLRQGLRYDKIKYELPGKGLITVSSDEYFRLMVEECKEMMKKLEPKYIRVFLM